MSNDNFTYLLNKWIENTISKKELDSLKQYKDFSSYQKILEHSKDFNVPHIDNNTSFNNFITKTNKKTFNPQKKGKQIKMSTVIIGIAASIALLFGIFNLFTFKNSYQTNFGEQLAIYLPDSSQVFLNSKSSIKFSEKDWNSNRLVELEGEALFKVKKGSKFKVQTEEGEIKVLGTEFNVKLDHDFLEVQCFEGKVAVTRKSQEFILTKGKAVRLIKNNNAENWEFTKETISWKNSEINLKNIPIEYLFSTIEKTFGVTITYKNINVEKRFSGSFPNNDIILALETISESLNIAYKISKNQKEVEFYKL